MKRRIESRGPRRIRGVTREAAQEYPYDPREITEWTPDERRKMDLLRQELMDRYLRGEIQRPDAASPQSQTDANEAYADLFTRWREGEEDMGEDYDKSYNDFEHQIENDEYR